MSIYVCERDKQKKKYQEKNILYKTFQRLYKETI